MALPFPISVTPFPFSIDRKLKRIPWATYSIMAANILVFLGFWIGAFSSLGSESYFLAFRQHWIFQIGAPSLLTLFTSAFTHVDFLHLAGNMLLLWLTGRVLEESIGSALFTLFYFTSIVTALLLYIAIHKAFDPNAMESGLLGASGAISGVMGLTAFRNYRLRIRTVPLLFIFCLPIPVFKPIYVPYLVYAIYFTVSEIWQGVTSAAVTAGMFNPGPGFELDNVAHWAHIGGLLMGVLAAMIFGSAMEGKRDYTIEDADKAVEGGASKYATLAELELLYKKSPDDPQILEAMGKLYNAQGQVKLARTFYMKALDAWLKLANPTAAAATYQNMVLNLPPTILDARTQMSMATALEGMGKYQEAVMAYDAVIEHHGGSDDAQTALFRGAQLRIRHLEDPVAGEWMLRTLIDDHPDSPWVHMAKQRLREMERQ